MTFVPVAGINEVFIEHQYNGKPGVGWVLHYETTAAGWTAPIFLDFGAAIVSWWDVHMQPLMGNTVQLQRIRMRDLTTQNSGVLDYTTGLPLTGTRTGNAVSANVAFSLKKNSGLAGRSFRGRVYQFGMTEDDSSANVVGTGYANAVRAAWNEALFLSGTLEDYAMVVVSKYSAGQPRAAGIATDVINFSYVDLQIDTRRDRLP